jgi:hypothetical protein
VLIRGLARSLYEEAFWIFAEKLHDHFHAFSILLYDLHDRQRAAEYLTRVEDASVRADLEARLAGTTES